ncbi:hypothetical protein IQ07DRAFT_599346 [Pyrenochaeta sp. DS3sAY3a]|nr:hypothetical protein IQ07DRAFT_599346 [Pyrenochaeta sp. DS3sAY3a]
MGAAKAECKWAGRQGNRDESRGRKEERDQRVSSDLATATLATATGLDPCADIIMLARSVPPKTGQRDGSLVRSPSHAICLPSLLDPTVDHRRPEQPPRPTTRRAIGPKSRALPPDLPKSALHKGQSLLRPEGPSFHPPLHCSCCRCLNLSLAAFERNSRSSMLATAHPASSLLPLVSAPLSLPGRVSPRAHMATNCFSTAFSRD